ncbi:DEAD/DEAH box helicase [Acidianus sp. RZ1]|uniref:DEAD/DEAH box helicase n=1 Tax=Acidianus sp. RZ1 TaxID=1540082 RepID=UPI0020A2614D|nr:DEAD/DEAH box helicase [Acidianus sp. RZ1]
MSFSEFDRMITEKLGYPMFPYQRKVSEDIVSSMEKHRFVIGSMPTGSGKTVVELFVAFYLLQRGFKNIIVFEPTRLLCDQMYSKFWKLVFPNVGVEYEGECDAFTSGKTIVVATPFTALKCNAKADAIIFDEVHHAFGDVRYTNALVGLKPRVVVGLTALLPSYKRLKLDEEIMKHLGIPYPLSYDYKALSNIDSTFKPPKAIADIFDAEMDSLEEGVYESFLRGGIRGKEGTIKFLEVTLYSYGKRAFCESLERLKENVQDNSRFFMLCDSQGLSHKARVLQDILSVYKIEDYKPVLIFTSRKATAYEFLKVVGNSERVALLTGDSSKEERQTLVNKAKKGEIDVIVSTIVGEEGIDIPEAKLLIMTDVPKVL